MTPTPVAAGVSLCDYVILEEGTRKVSPIGMFSKLEVESFPSPPQKFSVFAMLTDGLGLGRMEVSIARVDDMGEVYSQHAAVHFPDRLAVVYVRFRVRTCVFPTPGWFLVSLFIDNEWVGQRRLLVTAEGGTHHGES